MADDITLAELARQLQAFRRDVHDDLADISRRLDAYVLREVYASDQRGQEARMKAIEDRQKDDAAQRQADRRWIISAILLPIVVLAVQVVLALRGPA